MNENTKTPMQGLADWLRAYAANISANDESSACMRQWASEVDAASLHVQEHAQEGEKKLWLWRNFVDGRPEYWAFDNPYPCVSVGGDPLTLGEPCGYALLKPSCNGRPNISEDKVLHTIMSRAASVQSHRVEGESKTRDVAGILHFLTPHQMAEEIVRLDAVIAGRRPNITMGRVPKPPKCSRCGGEGTIDQTGYGEYRPCPDCNPESPYYEPPPLSIPQAQAPSITDEELTRRFTRSVGGPNPMYRCNGCGYEEYGVRNLLVAHAIVCGAKEDRAAPKDSGAPHEEGGVVTGGEGGNDGR